jgi:hypothetical protein
MIIAEEVQNKSQRKEFLEFPARLYQNDKNYIRPRNIDIEDIFDPEKNRFFKNGECARFLFKNKENKTVGKVAVFINETISKNSLPAESVFSTVSMIRKLQILFLIIAKTGFRKREWKQWTDRLISGSAINSGDW